MAMGRGNCRAAFLMFSMVPWWYWNIQHDTWDTWFVLLEGEQNNQLFTLKCNLPRVFRGRSWGGRRSSPPASSSATSPLSGMLDLQKTCEVVFRTKQVILSIFCCAFMKFQLVESGKYGCSSVLTDCTDDAAHTMRVWLRIDVQVAHRFQMSGSIGWCHLLHMAVHHLHDTKSRAQLNRSTSTHTHWSRVWLRLSRKNDVQTRTRWVSVKATRHTDYSVWPPVLNWGQGGGGLFLTPWWRRWQPHVLFGLPKHKKKVKYNGRNAAKEIVSSAR